MYCHLRPLATSTEAPSFEDFAARVRLFQLCHVQPTFHGASRLHRQIKPSNGCQQLLPPSSILLPRLLPPSSRVNRTKQAVDSSVFGPPAAQLSPEN
ncbi:hypothetical protein ACJRO7_026804 [Eucalyptus globulus]|uniref:Uncharacterized protein n=1 Tax=Eucalyptus globulus TaxID=34317 RepID=A0ABD3JZE6_EUCGL